MKTYIYPKDVAEPHHDEERAPVCVEWAIQQSNVNGGSIDLEVAWLTPCVTRGWLDLAVDGGRPKRIEEDPHCRMASWKAPNLEGYGVNHRALIRGVERVDRVSFTIAAEDRNGRVSNSSVYKIDSRDWKSLDNKPITVPLEVINTSDRDRVGVPVSAGVPFPKGFLGRPDEMMLQDSSGRTLPLQMETVFCWDDGSVKWLWIDFFADLPAKSNASYVLRAADNGDSEVSDLAIAVEESPEDVVIKTGVSALVVPKNGASADIKHYGFFRDGHESPAFGFPVSRTVDASGNRYIGEIDAVQVESAGPIHAVIKLKGTHRRDGDPSECLRFEMRIHSFAGKSHFLLEHTLCFAVTSGNSIEADAGVAEAQVGYGAGRTFEEHPDPRISRRQMLMRIREAAMLFDLPEVGDTPHARCSLADGGAVVIQDRDRLFQRDERTYRGSTGEMKGALDGRIELDDAVIAVENFSENYPKSAAVNNNGLEIGLFPAFEQQWYEGESFEDETKLYYLFREGCYHVHRGVEKTHRMVIDLSDSNEGTSHLHHPPIMHFDSAWVDSCGCFLPMPAGKEYPSYDDVIEQACDNLISTRQNNREYGALNYGDWHGERGANWGNLEYDLHHGLIRQFLRTGNPTMAIQATLAARHQSDVDVCHDSAWPEQIGGEHEHKVGHTGGYYGINTDAALSKTGHHDNKIVLGGTMDPGHFWVEGMIEHGLLFQDRRSLECGLLVADWMATAWPAGYIIDKYDRGWPLVGVTAAFRLTGDPLYLNAARVFAEKLVEAGGANGVVSLPLSHRHCGCGIEEHHGYATFIAGIHSTGKLLAFFAGGEERYEQSALKGISNIAEVVWHPEFCSFRNTTCPYTVCADTITGQIIDGICYAAWKSKDSRLASIGRNALAAMWEQISGQGKTVAVHTYKMPQALDWLAKTGGPEFESYRKELRRRWHAMLEQTWPTPVRDPLFSGDGWTTGPALSLTGGELTGTVDNDTILESRADTIVWIVPGEEHRLVVNYDALEWPDNEPPSFIIDDGEGFEATTHTDGPGRASCTFTAPTDFRRWRVRLRPPAGAGPIRLKLGSCNIFTTAQIAERDVYHQKAYSIDEAKDTADGITWKVRIPHEGSYHLWMQISGPKDNYRVDIPEWPKRNHDYKWLFFYHEAGADKPEACRWHAFRLRIHLPEGEHKLTITPEKGSAKIHSIFITDAC